MIRSTVKPHEKSPEEASEDRQFPKSKVVSAANSGQNEAPLQPPLPNAPPRSSTAAVSNIRDAESGIDGCEVEVKDITTDEQLPPGEGGVA